MADMPKPVPFTRKASGTKTKTTTARDYGTLHQKLRALRLKLYPICERCGQTWATIAHHLVRPATSIDHYSCVCLTCHREIHGGHA